MLELQGIKNSNFPYAFFFADFTEDRGAFGTDPRQNLYTFVRGNLNKFNLLSMKREIQYVYRPLMLQVNGLFEQ